MHYSSRPDAHAKPPEDLKAAYKKYQKITPDALESDDNVFDASRGQYAGFVENSQAMKDLQMPQEIVQIVKAFLADRDDADQYLDHSYSCYEHPDLPGLFVFPSLLSRAVQISLLDRLLHRDVSKPAHRNNLTLHYSVPYPETSSGIGRSFFDPSSHDIVLSPLDPTQHKSISVQSMLDKKLRWITLGGQYDWTAKEYPSSPPPLFPPDIAALINGIFPAIKPQAAILNLYSPGHTLSLHRDVSEECNRPLVSISLGCDGLFMAGLETEAVSKIATMRLSSGDVVVMSGQARYAWHGVPKILANTCPISLANWPVMPNDDSSKHYTDWKGWLSNKRINLNVRQMYS
ncbi:Alpha-ketoglutarate-dependent dioxygenase-like protein [Elsinoe fawcettii]|nr:Alpha-ketoglutarate-dependent dioxygenase-like protein [Elsinoe fawcettii]